MLNLQGDVMVEKSIIMPSNNPLDIWLNTLFTKIVVGCSCEQDLFDLEMKANELGILNCLIKDAGLTEFSEPTFTCIAIGPDLNDRIDLLTQDFPLL